MIIPEPLSAKDPNSFAYATIKDRLPVILTKAIDMLCRQRRDLAQLGFVTQEEAPMAEKETKEVIAKLSKLRNEMVTDKNIIPIMSSASDVSIWNGYLSEYVKTHGCEPTWFGSPWLYVECYMYRRLRESLELSKYLTRYDAFEESKQDSIKNSIDAVKIISKYLTQLINEDITTLNIKKKFFEMIQLCLWGNKCDLSLSQGAQVSQSSDPLNDLAKFREFILCDKTEQLWQSFCDLKCKRDPIKLAIILDNSGFELFTDLCLVEFLSSLGLLGETYQIYFYVKSIPWFVSDVMVKDFHWALDWMSNTMTNTNTKINPNLNDEIESDANLNRNHDCQELVQLANKWKMNLSEKRWQIIDDPFWTYPHDFSQMNQVSPDLYHQLSGMDLVLFKGDLNYRKLVGDLKWDVSVSLETALRGFIPTNIIILRTLKADVVVGIEDENVLRKIERKELVDNWMISGDYAVIQFFSKDVS